MSGQVSKSSVRTSGSSFTHRTCNGDSTLVTAADLTLQGIRLHVADVNEVTARSCCGSRDLLPARLTDHAAEV